jgi:hypothetical protein
MPFTTNPWLIPLAQHPDAALYEHCGLHDFSDDPLYAVLCRLIARSPELLALHDMAPPTQRRAVLLLAALHLCVLRGGPQQPGLPGWYGSVGGQRSPQDPALPAALAAFAQAHDHALQRLLTQRRTQTNETGRCTVLRPALDAIAQRHPGRPLALFDFGASAGLNLAVDRYRIHYRNGGHTHATGPADAAGPPLHCEVVGAPPEGLFEPPRWHIAARCGTDLAPVDLHDPNDTAWLRACLWPGDAARRERLDMALAVARDVAAPVIAAEDGLQVLEDWLATLPASTLPVLFNTWVLAYFTPEMLAAHAARVHALVQQRGLLWLSAEDAPRMATTTGLRPPERPVPGMAHTAPTSHTFWTLTEPGPAGVRHTLLARSHPHGAWLEWVAGRGATPS